MAIYPSRPPPNPRLNLGTAPGGWQRWLLAVLLLLLGMGFAQASDDLSSGRIFGQTGRKFTNFRPIPQWSELLERYREEERRDSRCRESGQGNCPYTDWMRLIERLRGQDRTTQIREVNNFANRWSYITDPVNWGVEDYWATPAEFFRKAGDCEDYAIVKFMSLRALGFRNEELSLAAVQDLNLRVGHVVTLVSMGGRVMVLDNQIKQVVPTTTIRHYKPVYAANENAWWLFK